MNTNKNMKKKKKTLPFWITAARQEEMSGRIQEARDIIIYGGCQDCPQNEDIWLEACRLAGPDEVRGVLKKGLTAVPDSTKLWLYASEMELDIAEKIRVLKNGLKFIPYSLELCLALAIARVETPNTAREVLKKAKERLPCNEPAICVSAEKLEGVNRNRTYADVMTNAAMCGKEEGCSTYLKRMRITNDTDISNTKKLTILSTNPGSFLFKKSEDIWMLSAKEIWLTGAEEKRRAGKLTVARAILQQAYSSIPHSEEIWLAAFELEFENHELERARKVLEKACEKAGTKRVWMKSAIVERELGNSDEERLLLQKGLKRFSSFFKLWLMLGQLEERLGRFEQAKEVYQSGLRHCPFCIPLWLSLSNLEERTYGLSEGRAVLTVARAKNPKNPELWLGAIRAETRHGNNEEADSLMAEALQECPNSGVLWAASIEMAPQGLKKSISAEAIKKCDKDPHLLVAIAKLFWDDWEEEKARIWLNKAVSFSPDIGDFWAFYYKFELEQGTRENQEEVLRRCVLAGPKHGEKWQVVSKAVENSHQNTEAILKKVALSLR